MISLRERGTSYAVDYTQGTARLRGALGTRSRAAALLTLRRLETALAEGPRSPLWEELRAVLPTATFARFSQHVGYSVGAPRAWLAFHAEFLAFLDQRITLGKFAASTKERYAGTLREFSAYLAACKITTLPQITVGIAADFQPWRQARIRERPFHRGGQSLALDVAILHRALAWAVEREYLAKNPIRSAGRPGADPVCGAEPFTATDLAALRLHAGPDLLAVLWLRWTGLRGADACAARLGQIDFPRAELSLRTGKNKRDVTIPLHAELMAALDARRRALSGLAPAALAQQPVLPGTRHGTPLTRKRLYHRLLAIGKRAGVPNAHPHRFRDTLAVDLLSRGATIYDVAKVLGDTVAMVEQHYARFVPALRDRVRSLLADPTTGLEAPAVELKGGIR